MVKLLKKTVVHPLKFSSVRGVGQIGLLRQMELADHVEAGLVIRDTVIFAFLGCWNLSLIPYKKLLSMLYQFIYMRRSMYIYTSILECTT